MNKLFLFTLAWGWLFLLTACASSGSSQELTGSIWLLTELNGEEPLPDTNITAEFDQEGRVGGSSGCNSYGTSYNVDGNKITFGAETITTMMACPEPIMEQERNYLIALEATATFEINDDELILFNADGDEVARFTAIDQSLAGSSWQVIGYNNGKGGVVSVIIDTEITASFGEDDQLTGNAGCNDYFAAYEIDGDQISIGPAGATRKMCSSPEGIMEQEQQYLAALETAETYKVEGVRMEMRTSEGALVADFQRVVEP